MEILDYIIDFLKKASNNEFYFIGYAERVRNDCEVYVQLSEEASYNKHIRVNIYSDSKSESTITYQFPGIIGYLEKVPNDKYIEILYLMNKIKQNKLTQLLS